MYIVNYTETGWWGTWQIPHMDAYNKVRAQFFEEYEASMLERQNIAEQLPPFLCFRHLLLPYRTDKLDGWITWAGE